MNPCFRSSSLWTSEGSKIYREYPAVPWTPQLVKITLHFRVTSVFFGMSFSFEAACEFCPWQPEEFWFHPGGIEIKWGKFQLLMILWPKIQTKKFENVKGMVGFHRGWYLLAMCVPWRTLDNIVSLPLLTTRPRPMAIRSQHIYWDQYWSYCEAW